jgi:hypothetical protein
MEDFSETEQYLAGYARQKTWLAGQGRLGQQIERAKTIREARLCLDARLSTCDNIPWNVGATQATHDYIKQREAVLDYLGELNVKPNERELP